MSPAKAKVARNAFVAEARKYIGYPYAYGAVGPKAFDCSGYVYYVANRALNRQIPRTAKAMYNYCRIIPDKQREPGDLLFFKTTFTGTVSHVGIYLGNNQFISALSDGPNAGVVISSLNQDYWRTRYIAAGQFLGTGNLRDEKPAQIAKAEKKTEKTDEFSEEKFIETSSSRKNYVTDFAVLGNWTLFSPNEFMFKFKGVDIQTNIRFAKIPLQPGFGLNFRINTGLGFFQIPVLFSATLNENMKLYAGPVLSFGSPNEKIDPSVFPGIIGVSFATPKIGNGSFSVQLVQDLSYTIYNNMDNSALNFVDSIASGFLFNTGLKISYDF